MVHCFLFTCSLKDFVISFFVFVFLSNLVYGKALKMETGVVVVIFMPVVRTFHELSALVVTWHYCLCLEDGSH